MEQSEMLGLAGLTPEDLEVLRSDTSCFKPRGSACVLATDGYTDQLGG